MIGSISLVELQDIAAGRPVLIFGAGAVGELLLQIFRGAGISVGGFLDNNSGMAGKEKGGAVIYSPEEIYGKLSGLPIVVSAADIGDIVTQLHGMGCEEIFPAGPLLKEVDVSKYKMSVSADFLEYTTTSCMSCHDSYLTSDKIFLRSVDVVITERCSLKCKDCSNLMQYYEHPENCEFDEIKRSIEAICSVVDGINEFRVIGGEPFMNKDIGLVLDLLIENDKARKILIYTNGTIIPKESLIPRLANEKVLMLITDYGDLSPRMSRLLEFLDANGISYYRRPAENWTDCSRIVKHNRSEEESRQVFQECCCKSLFTLMSGRLYRCPFVANADRLRAIPDLKDSYVELLSGRARVDLLKDVKDFVFGRSVFEACDFCDGRPLSAPHIVPAIQTKQPLLYLKYVTE